MTDGLLAIMNRSIEAAEKGRESAESRMRELEGQLQEQQEQRTQLLEAEVKKLRGENTLLRGQLKVGGGASISSAEGADAPSGAELDLAERTAAVYAWLASMYLKRKQSMTVETVTFAATGVLCVAELLFSDANLLDDVDPRKDQLQLTDYEHGESPRGAGRRT